MPGLACYTAATQALLRAAAAVPRLVGVQRFAGAPVIEIVPAAQIVALEPGAQGADAITALFLGGAPLVGPLSADQIRALREQGGPLRLKILVNAERAAVCPSTGFALQVLAHELAVHGGGYRGLVEMLQTPDTDPAHIADYLERGFTPQTAMEPTAGHGYLTPLQQHIMFGTNHDLGYEALAKAIRDQAATLDLSAADIEAFDEREVADKQGCVFRAHDHFKAVAQKRTVAKKPVY